MSEITRGVMGMPYEMTMGSDLSRRQFYSIAREVYSENQRLLESLQSMIDQTTPLVPIPVDPMWSRRVKIDELMAENESMRADAERYRKLSKVTPYRFKKMQEASVTDGGDVLYFHADRFSALLDAISSPENH